MEFSRFPLPLPSCHLPSSAPDPEILAGAEGFEPPSSVLETDSLTVELTPLFPLQIGDFRLQNEKNLKSSIANLQLLYFLMRRMLAADAAEFLQLQPLCHSLAILGGRIVPLFAITALHRNNFSGHKQLLASGS
jgi:hypothetical protein